MRFYKKIVQWLSLSACVVLLVACATSSIELYDPQGNPIIPGQNAGYAFNENPQEINTSSFKVLIANPDSVFGYQHQRIGNALFYINPMESMDIHDLYDIVLVPQGNKTAVKFIFSHPGQKKLEDLSRRYVGQLLILVSNDHLLARYNIKGAVTSGSLQINGLSSEEAKSIQSDILNAQ